MQAHDLHYQRPTPWHSEQAKAAAKPEKGLASIALGAKALAPPVPDLIEDPARLAAIKADHADAPARQEYNQKTFYLLTYYTILDIMPLIQKKEAGAVTNRKMMCCCSKRVFAALPL